MVLTRRSSEPSGFTPDIREIRRNKAHEIREDESSDESGHDTKPISAKRRRLHNKEVIVNRSRERLRHNQTPEPRSFSPLKTRRKSRERTDERRENLDATTASQERDQTPSRRISKGKKDRVNYQKAIAGNPKLIVSLDDNGPSIRRSCRERRGVYDTLNVQMLTDQRNVHPNFENVVQKQGKRRRKRSEYSVNSDSECELDQQGNMYDMVKRKHDTPSPEKKDQRRSGRLQKQEEGEDGDEEEEDSDDDDEDEDDDDEEEDDDGEDEDEDVESQRNRYLLRKKKPTINRYTAPVPRVKNKRDKKHFQIAARRRQHHLEPPPHASPIRRYRAHKKKAMNMSSSSTSEGSCDEQDERRFERRKSKSMAKARNRALPINLTIEDISKGVLRERESVGSSLADVDPMSVDRKVKFDSVGGLGKQIRALKEMILFPLVYPEYFDKYKITPPRGVLFFGPPGTGKTLVARALANECSQGDKKVSFFMRKGADCLSKWVGESERQLRLLFDQAYAMRPSIIFFDEIDGLAPVRSSRQDQIHSSIVSTLLALMDGLDSRGEVVVIGATNRVDAIDPALRRPGRFDREFQFPLPDRNARRSILSIHTKEWEPKLSQSFINELADFCVGYCGADVKALCTEAALFALRRSYPQVYDSNKKLLLDINNIEVTYKDFLNATKNIVPAHQRSVASPARALSGVIKPLLEDTLSQALTRLGKAFPSSKIKTAEPTCSLNQQAFSDDELSSDDDNVPDIYDHTQPTTPASGTSRSERYMRRMMQRQELIPNNIHVLQPPTASRMYSFSEKFFRGPISYRPRLLLAGREGMGQSTHLAPALLHSIEHLSVHCLDLPALYGVASRTPEEACAQLFREARRTSPCVVYMPHLGSLWLATSESLHATLMSLLFDLPPLTPVLLLATADRDFHELPVEIQQLFSPHTGQVICVSNPDTEARRSFFRTIFLEYALMKPKQKKKKRNVAHEVLPLAPSPPPRQLSEAELKKIQQNEENTMRELRIFLRDVHHKLITDRRFKEFSKPVDLDEVDDYLNIIEEPMDLSTMMQRIDRHQYSTCAQYLLDVDLITSNALKYNPDRDPLDKIIRHRACELRDVGHSLIKSQLEPEFEKACEEIVSSRERRGEKSSAVAPAYVFTAPRVRTSSNNRTMGEQVQHDPAPPSTGSAPQPSAPLNEQPAAAAGTSSRKSTTVATSSGKSAKKKRPCVGRPRRFRRRQLKDEMDKEGDTKGTEQSDVVFVDDNDVGNHVAGEHDESFESMIDKEPAEQDNNEEHTCNDAQQEGVGDSAAPKNEDEIIDSINKELLGDDFEHLIKATDSKSVENESASLGVIQNGESLVLQELEQTGHVTTKTASPRAFDGKEPHSPAHDGEEPQSAVHDGKELSSPVHDGKEPRSPVHDGKELSSPVHYGNDAPSPVHDGIDPPSPVHDGKDSPSPFDEGKAPLSAAQIAKDALVLNQDEEKTHGVKKCVHFAETNGVENGVVTSLEEQEAMEVEVEENKEDNTLAQPEEPETIDTDMPQHGDEAESRWKHKLEQLLTWLVDTTEGSSVETLERCHNTLQLTVHQHRNDTDKSTLIQELEDTITAWTREGGIHR